MRRELEMVNGQEAVVRIESGYVRRGRRSEDRNRNCILIMINLIGPASVGSPREAVVTRRSSLVSDVAVLASAERRYGAETETKKIKSGGQE